MTELKHDYSLRGKCLVKCLEAVALDPSLKLVRGEYYCPIWNEIEDHCWLVRPDGTIEDPTAAQYPSCGMGQYLPFEDQENPTLQCSECGKDVKFNYAYCCGNGRHFFCTGECFGRFVGVL